MNDKEFFQEFPSFEEEFFHGVNNALVRKVWVEKHCLDKQRVKKVIVNSLKEVGIQPENFGDVESSDKITCFVGLLKKGVGLE